MSRQHGDSKANISKTRVSHLDRPRSSYAMSASLTSGRRDGERSIRQRLPTIARVPVPYPVHP